MLDNATSESPSELEHHNVKLCETSQGIGASVITYGLGWIYT